MQQITMRENPSGSTGGKLRCHNKKLQTPETIRRWELGESVESKTSCHLRG